MAPVCHFLSSICQLISNIFKNPWPIKAKFHVQSPMGMGNKTFSVAVQWEAQKTGFLMTQLIKIKWGIQSMATRGRGNPANNHHKLTSSG